MVNLKISDKISKDLTFNFNNDNKKIYDFDIDVENYGYDCDDFQR